MLMNDGKNGKTAAFQCLGVLKTIGGAERARKDPDALGSNAFRLGTWTKLNSYCERSKNLQ